MGLFRREEHCSVSKVSIKLHFVYVLVMLIYMNIQHGYRPVHHRIPNFVGADTAAQSLATLPEFKAANIIKVNPDTPQRRVRHNVLEQGKTLLTPQPRLRTGFFQTLRKEDVMPDVPVEALTTSKGAVSLLH